MNESFQVDPTELVSHARVLNGLVNELRAALADAGAVSLTAEAYGETARAAAVALETAAKAGRTTIQAGVDALDRTGGELRASANTYEEQEHREMVRMRTIDGGGPPAAPEVPTS